ncbi:MAG TPA: hypothetical protein PKV48_00495 [Thermodesulfobacteriota bacterium]|nr:hypothetical protein [Thermodesulfobacteriota bacterium]
MKVILYSFTDDGKRRKVAEVFMKEDQTVCTKPNLLKDDERYGIVNVAEGKLKELVYPKDGEVFLRNLPYHYKNPYLFAELVELDHKEKKQNC